MLLEEFGDGIMSAIDMFATITDVEGKLGEKRLVLTLNGKVTTPRLRVMPFWGIWPFGLSCW